MKLCTMHDDALRVALAARGLGALVSDDEELSKKHLADALHCGLNVDNFDARELAYNGIVNNTLACTPQHQAAALLTVKPDGSEVCPLCFLLETRGCRHDHWIDLAVDEVVAEWRKLGPGVTS